MSSPKYANGKEVGPRKKPPTAEQINRANKAFWAARTQPPAPVELSEMQKMIAKANAMTLFATVREERAKTEATVLSTVKAAKRAEQVKGGKEKGKARKNMIADRNRLIRELRAAGKRTDQIRKNADVINLNKSKKHPDGTPLSIAQINKIAPRRK